MALSDSVMTVGDVGWRGFRSRPDPLTLPEGVAAVAENIRFVRGRAEVRRGIKRLADDVVPGSVPLVLPFALAGDKAVTSLTRSGATATAVSVAHGYVTGDQVAISGADQAEYNGDKVVTRVDADTFTFSVAGSPASPATGVVVANNGPEVRDSYVGGIFGAVVFSSPASSVTGNGDEWVVLFGSDRAWLWRDGEASISKTYPTGETVEEEDELAAVQAFDKVYLFRARALTGSYARKSCTVTSAAGTATVTCVGHGYETGERVCIEGADQAGYNIEADITRTGADTFTFAVSHAPASPATGTLTCRRVKAPLVWDGDSGNFVRAGGGSHPAGATYSTLRSAGVVCYNNNCMVACPTPVKDTVVVSDALDANTFDPLLKAFRANAGSDDRIVALHAFAEGEVVVLGRKSIYRARIVIGSDGQSIDTAESFLQLITNEVGCRAKNTVVTAGSFVFFLSDSGVYRLDTNYTDLRLRGVTQPLSDAVADVFEDINEEAVGLSSAVWFDSRYWLTIPRGEDTAPNTMLVWSALNEEWESVDRFPTGIHTLLVSDYAERRRLFGVSRTGKLFLMEEREDGDDPADPSVTATEDIEGRLVTRRYNGGDMEAKRWLKVVASCVLPAGAGVAVTLRTFDLDNELALGTVTNTGAASEDYVLKMSGRARGAAADVVVEATGPGRPVLKSVQVDVSGARPSADARTTQ